VRITAQLISTSDSTHLWSERYDRPLDDIFAVQDEISNAIVQALQIHLMRGTLSGRQGGTQNPEAYELYLRAWNGEDRDNAPSLDAAERYLQRAIDLDPEFSVAWSALATVTLVKVENGYLDTKEGFERIRHLTQHALQLNPNNAHAHSLLAGIYMAYDRDWPAAEVEVQRALTLDPTNPDSLNDAGRLSAARGRWDDAERQFRAALVRDPVHDYVIFNLGLTYYRARRFADAEREFRELLEVEPGFPWTRGMLGLTLLLQGKTEAALAIVQQDVDEEMKLLTLPLALWAAGRHDEADQTLRAQIRHWGDRGAYYVALSYAHRDDRDRTLEWLQRAYEQGDPALFEMFGDPLFDSIADDPRFKAFLRKMKLPEWPQSSVAATGT
jgi:tetratricopeptide (TPR) repeat protein